MQEILELQNLLNNNGELSEQGCYNIVKYNYNKEDSKLSSKKVKEEDLYVIYNHFNAFVISISKVSKFIIVTVSLIDLIGPWVRRKEFKINTSKDDINMPSNPRIGDIVIKSNSSTIIIKNNMESRRILCHVEDFSDGVPVDADISLMDMPDELIAINDVYGDDAKNYIYNCKINNMKAHGIVRFQNKEHLFKPENSFANLQWYRGYNFHNKDYYNAVASGYLNSDKISFNVGLDINNIDYNIENTIINNNCIEKFGKIQIFVNETQKKKIFKSIINLKNTSDQIDLKFTPIANCSFDDKSIKKDIIFGFFDGTIITSINTYNIEEFTGFIIN